MFGERHLVNLLLVYDIEQMGIQLVYCMMRMQCNAAAETEICSKSKSKGNV